MLGAQSNTLQINCDCFLLSNDKYFCKKFFCSDLSLEPQIEIEMHLKCSFETENIFTVLVIKCVCVFMRRINQISSIDLWRNFTHVYGSATNPHWVQDPPWSLNGPAMALQYTKHGPLYIGYIFAFYTTKMGSRDSGDTKVNPHWV